MPKIVDTWELAFWRADATLLQQRLQAVVQSGASVSAPTLNCIPDQRSLRRCGQAFAGTCA